jgi:hypothetical protein
MAVRTWAATCATTRVVIVSIYLTVFYGSKNELSVIMGDESFCI